MISNLVLPQGMLIYFRFFNIILLKKTIRDKTKSFLWFCLPSFIPPEKNLPWIWALPVTFRCLICCNLLLSRVLGKTIFLQRRQMAWYHLLNSSPPPSPVIWNTKFTDNLTVQIYFSQCSLIHMLYFYIGKNKCEKKVCGVNTYFILVMEALFYSPKWDMISVLMRCWY